MCECAWGFFYDAKTDSCQTPKLWGQKCISNADCEAENFICSTTTFKCVCPSGFHFDPIHPGCKINADSSCDRGYRWDEDWGRCIPVRSAASAFPFNSLTGVNILGSRTKSTSLDRSGNTDHSGSSVHSSKPDSNGETGSSSVTTALILILPNVIAFALILRYCYYRKREEDSSDLTDDLERGNFAIRSAHLHNLTKFCAYPPYTTRTILPGSSIKSHHGTCLGTTVVGYPGDMAIGTCCVANVTATGKVVHGKSTLEAVEETDEPLGSLNQESPEGEIANGSCTAMDGNEVEQASDKSSPAATVSESKLQLEEQTSKKKDDSTIDPDDVTFSSCLANTGSESDSGQRINSPPTHNVVKCDKKEFDLATPDGTSVKLTTSPTPKVTVVKFSPTTAGKKLDLEVVVKGGEELEARAVNVESFTSPLNTHFACDGIDRQSSHFILKETSSDGSCLFTSGGSKSSPVTSSSPAMSPCTRKHSTSTDDELPVQGANST